MRTSFGPILGLALALAATPALADEGETKAITVSGGATLVSDYRFRGISQTDKDPAIQGSVTVSHESGLYVGIWGSSIDDYVSAGADQEIDLIAGFKKTAGAATFDVGVTYYYYPGSEKIVPGYNSDFAEFYGSVSGAVGPVSAKLGAFYAPSQSALDYGFGKEDNFYLNLGLSASIPDTGVSLAAGIGHTFTKSYMSGGQKYTDWNVGVSYTTGPVTLGLSYVDTDGTAFSLTGKNVMKGGIVGTLGVAF